MLVLKEAKTQSQFRDTSGQKWLLQRRNEKGHIKKVDSFTQPITPEEALKLYGPGDYILKTTRPRFATVWKQDYDGKDHDEKLRKIEKKTNYIGCGLIGVAAAEGIGFWLIHKRFRQIETFLQTFPVDHLSCGQCGKHLDFFLQKSCSQCTTPIDWTKKPSNSSTEADRSVSLVDKDSNAGWYL